MTIEDLEDLGKRAEVGFSKYGSASVEWNDHQIAVNTLLPEFIALAKAALAEFDNPKGGVATMAEGTACAALKQKLASI